MAVSLVQTKSGDSGAYTNSFSFSFTSNVGVGDDIFINITSGNADTISSVTDNLGNTYAQDVASSNPTTGERQSRLYHARVTTGGACTVTITYTSGQFPDTSYIAREYSGLASSALDQTSSNNDGTSFNQTHDAGTTSATTQASELVILFGGSSGSASPTAVAGSGYGNGLEQKGFDAFTYGFMSDKIVSSTGAQSGNFTTTAFVRGQAGIATYKAAVTATTRQTIMLTGVGS